MNQNRLKSPVLWISLFTLITFVLKTYFDVEIEQKDVLIDLIMSVLIGFGVLNNPTRKDKL